MAAALHDGDVLGVPMAGRQERHLPGFPDVEQLLNRVVRPADGFLRSARHEANPRSLEPLGGCPLADQAAERAGDPLRVAKVAAEADRRRGDRTSPCRVNTRWSLSRNTKSPPVPGSRRHSSSEVHQCWPKSCPSSTTTASKRCSRPALVASSPSAEAARLPRTRRGCQGLDRTVPDRAQVVERPDVRRGLLPGARLSLEEGGRPGSSRPGRTVAPARRGAGPGPSPARSCRCPRLRSPAAVGKDRQLGDALREVGGEVVGVLLGLGRVGAVGVAVHRRHQQQAQLVEVSRSDWRGRHRSRPAWRSTSARSSIVVGRRPGRGGSQGVVRLSAGVGEDDEVLDAGAACARVRLSSQSVSRWRTSDACSIGLSSSPCARGRGHPTTGRPDRAPPGRL